MQKVEREAKQNAAENIRIYLKFSPNAPDAAAVKQLLNDIEKAGGEPPANPRNNATAVTKI